MSGLVILSNSRILTEMYALVVFFFFKAKRVRACIKEIQVKEHVEREVSSFA